MIGMSSNTLSSEQGWEAHIWMHLIFGYQLVASLGLIDCELADLSNVSTIEVWSCM